MWHTWTFLTFCVADVHVNFQLFKPSLIEKLSSHQTWHAASQVNNPTLWANAIYFQVFLTFCSLQVSNTPKIDQNRNEANWKIEKINLVPSSFFGTVSDPTLTWAHRHATEGFLLVGLLWRRNQSTPSKKSFRKSTALGRQQARLVTSSRQQWWSLLYSSWCTYSSDTVRGVDPPRMPSWPVKKLEKKLKIACKNFPSTLTTLRFFAVDSIS